MKLSVVVLNYNVRYFLELCIKSVQAAIYDLDAEIIVIDNNSCDESCELLKQKFPEIILIENKDNVGFSKANNQGVEKASGEYICILNPDTVVAEDTFVKLLNFAKTKEKLGIVGCRLIDGVGNYLPESKRNVPLLNVAIKKILGNSKRYYANHVEENDIAKVDILVGAFMFMKRELYLELKGFDEDYFMYGEDIDLSYRVLNKGYDNFYYGATTIIHFKGESTLKDKNYARRFYSAMQIFYEKHFKTNIAFDFMVWAGIKMAYLFRIAQKRNAKIIGSYYFVSGNRNTALENSLDKSICLSNGLANFEADSEIIFDVNVSGGYKSVIQGFSELNKKQDLTFKILPHNSNYIIGSDHAFSRGEVIVFDEN